jgi:hypothetical protein
MDKGNKFVDPMAELFTPPPHKTKIVALRDFIYDSDEGSCFGRTPKLWCKYRDVKQTGLKGTRFKAITAVLVLMTFFWVKSPCELVGRNQRFGEECCSHLQG